MHWPDTFFVTGTDTGIGKTLVSAILTAGLKATYWKPVQSGLEEETDTQAVRRMTGLPDTHFKPETYRLNEPLSPHASAAIDGVSIRMDAFSVPTADTRHLIIEGAGGVLVPLNERALIIDLMARLSVPALVVARSGLGTLNHTLLTLEALRRRDIPVMGVVMNGPQNTSNREALEHYGQTEILAELPVMNRMDPTTVRTAFEHHF